MSEREEKLINKIMNLQNAHNSLNLEDEIEKYKKEIKEVERGVEKTKNEIKKLSSELDNLENNSENNSVSANERNIVNRKNLLNNIINENNIKTQQLKNMKEHAENFQKEDFIRNLIQHWEPQTMFKYVKLYDKKHN